MGIAIVNDDVVREALPQGSVNPGFQTVVRDARRSRGLIEVSKR